MQKVTDHNDDSASDHEQWDIPIHADYSCSDRLPSTIYDLQHIFADSAEAAAICEFHRLSNKLAANQHGLARHDIRALEKAFPHLDFPTILQLLREAFPQNFDHESGAAAQSHGHPNS